MNYSIISIFNLEYKSLIGGAFLILSHAFVSSGLFLLIGILYIRYSTRIYFYYQHLANFMPLFTTYFFLLILNLISIPFSSSFISEFLMLSGLLKSNLFICILFSFSLFLNTLYSIWFFNRLSFGLSPTLSNSRSKDRELSIIPGVYIYKWKDLSINEFLSLFPFVFFSFFFGIFPNPILHSLSLSILRLLP